MARIKWDCPVGTPEERASDRVWCGAWVDATGYATYYTATGKGAFHTGADLNLNKPAFDADREAPVYACADGVVVYAAKDSVWGKNNALICIMHRMGNGAYVWSRYAHVINLAVGLGDGVSRGQQIAQIGNAGGRYPYHLHFDISWIDLGARPGDWPGADCARLARSYVDPRRFIEVMR